jgi:hypothetical protein
MRIQTVGLALCATLTCAALAAQDAQAPMVAATALCDPCGDVCTLPLSLEDVVLDETTDTYIATAARESATAAAIELASRLKDIFREYKAGHYGRAYKVYAADIESLARKIKGDRATSAEIRSLKRVRTALYADTVVGLRAAGERSHSKKFLAIYAPREAVLDGVLVGLSASQRMRAAERLAVCEVLAAYRR